MTQQKQAYAFALTAVLCWSTVATAFKLTLRQVDPLQMLFYACCTAAAVLALVLVIKGRYRLLFSALRRHWRATMVAGLLNPCVYYIVLFAAYDRLPAQVAQPINYSWAIVLTLLSIIVLKQKITFRDILAALVCYGGVLVIATQGQLRLFVVADAIGVLLALASTVIWASYWIINIRDVREPDVALCLNFLVAIPFIAVLCAVFSEFRVTQAGLFGSIYIGIFEMALPFLLWSYALKLSANTSRVSNLIFLSPFVSLVLIHYVLGEAIMNSTYVGLILIIGGLLYQQYNVRPRKVPG